MPERLERRRVEDHLPRLGQGFGCGELVDETPGQDLDELDLRVTDDEAPCRSHGHGDLQREVHGGGSRRDDLADPSHRLLHGERARRRPHAVVPVEPAREGVAAEVDDVAAEAIEVGDHGVEHPVQGRRQLLGAALRPHARPQAPPSAA